MMPATRQWWIVGRIRFSQHQLIATEQSHRCCGSHDVVDGDHVARCGADRTAGVDLESIVIRTIGIVTINTRPAPSRARLDSPPVDFIAGRRVNALDGA